MYIVRARGEALNCYKVKLMSRRLFFFFSKSGENFFSLIPKWCKVVYHIIFVPLYQPERIQAAVEPLVRRVNVRTCTTWILRFRLSFYSLQLDLSALITESLIHHIFVEFIIFISKFPAMKKNLKNFFKTQYRDGVKS